MATSKRFVGRSGRGGFVGVGGRSPAVERRARRVAPPSAPTTPGGSATFQTKSNPAGSLRNETRSRRAARPCALRSDEDYRRAVRASWRRLILWRARRSAAQDEQEQVVVEKVAVCGGGAFGTALATVLARKYGEAAVTVLVRDAEVARSISEDHVNPRVEWTLPGNVRGTTFPADALEGCDLIVWAIPVQASTSFVEKVKDHVPPRVPVVSVSKGLEVTSCRTMHEVLERALGEDQPLVALSGPSFAKEVMEGLPTNLVAASEDERHARFVQQVFASPTLRVNVTRDVMGVEIGGALKNVVAIAAGIVDGLGLGNNALSALVAQGTAEIRWLAVRMGAEASTITGIAGVGDIMLTSFVNLSRNRTVGVRLGKGESLDEILSSMTQVRSSNSVFFFWGGGAKETGMLTTLSYMCCISFLPQVAEGVKTAQVVIALAKKYNLVLPVLTAVAQVVDGQIDAKEAVDTVMTFPQIDDVDRGYDFYKEGEPTAASPSSSREPSNELSGV